MAYVDLTTKKIVGAKEGTLTYYHEQAHLEYDNTRYGEIVRTVQDFTNRLLIVLIVLAIITNTMNKFVFLNYLLVGVLFINIISEIKEEVDCWKRARIKRGY